MSNILDTLRAAISGRQKAATDSMAADGSTAGLIRNRRDAALACADADDPAACVQARLTRQQHADHTGNSGHE